MGADGLAPSRLPRAERQRLAALHGRVEVYRNRNQPEADRTFPDIARHKNSTARGTTSVESLLTCGAPIGGWKEPQTHARNWPFTRGTFLPIARHEPDYDEAREPLSSRLAPR